MDDHGRMQIGELSSLSGVPRHTIHYYLKRGVLHQPERTAKTRAYYDRSHLERLHFIEESRRKHNHSLSNIKNAMKGDVYPGAPQTQHDEMRESRKGEESRGTERVAKKQRMLEAAVELFSRKGYHHTSIKDIAEYLGISTGTFYIYFESKKDIFVQAVAKAVGQTRAEVDHVIDREEDFYVRNRLRIEALREHYPSFSEIFTQLRAEAVAGDGLASKKVEQIFHEFADPLVREFRQAMDQGLLRRTDPDLLASCMIGMVDMLLYRETLDGEYGFDDIVDFLFDFLMRGLGPVHRE